MVDVFLDKPIFVFQGASAVRRFSFGLPFFCERIRFSQMVFLSCKEVGRWQKKPRDKW